MQKCEIVYFDRIHYSARIQIFCADKALLETVGKIDPQI